MPDKNAETIADLIIDQIFPRFGSCLQLVTDNGTENVIKVVRETLEKLKIDHVLTSVYHPQSNGKVERLHRTLHDILAKKVADNQQTWDLHLNQALAAIRFNVSESTKFSPFFLLYNWDVVLPVDNILSPRRKYAGEEYHKIALQEQHKSFAMVRNHLKRVKKKQAKYADKGAKTVEFEVGDPVFYKNNQRKGKLDSDSEENMPLAELARRHRHERETSEDEDDIPLMELRKRLRYRESRQQENENNESMINSGESEKEMDIDEIHVRKPRHIKKRTKTGDSVKKLLRLVSEML